MAALSTLRDAKQVDLLAALVALVTRYLRPFHARFKAHSRQVRLLGLISVALAIIASGTVTRRWWKQQMAEKEQGKRLLRRNSGLRLKDGSRVIYVPYKDSTSKVTIHPTKSTTFDAHRRLFLNPPRAARLPHDAQSNMLVPPPQTKPGLNLAFLHQFLSLMSIMIPRWSSKETALLLSHGAFLLLRTYLSLLVARLDGEIVRDLVAGHGRSFVWGILKVRSHQPINSIC